MRKQMKCLAILFLLLLTSCSGDNNMANPDKTKETAVVTTAAVSVSPPVNLDLLAISGIVFTDPQNNKAEHDTAELIHEFKSFLSNQDYSVAEADYSGSYGVRLLAAENELLLGLSISERSISFDRNVEIKGKLYEKGITYETGEWINEYMNQFSRGNVLNPVRISEASKIAIPSEYFDAAMIKAGDHTVNKYETMTALHDFIKSSFTGREYEITDCRRLYSDGEFEREKAKAEKAFAVAVKFEYDDRYMQIGKEDSPKKMIRGEDILLYRDQENSRAYRLLANNEVMGIKVDEAFDKGFQELFSNDLKHPFKLGASEVEELLAQKKPYFLEYLCRNLGMDMWNQRGEDTVKKSVIQLDEGKQYTLFTMVNDFNSRLMLFNSKTGNYVDYIDFGGRQAGTEHEIQKAGPYIWIAGNRCYGYGTGESIYYREWYALEDTGKKRVLNIPYNIYLVGPYGGSIVEAQDIRLEDGDGIRLTVNYRITRVYRLEIDETDQYGQVSVTAHRIQEFEFDRGQGKFTSGLPEDENGLTQISHKDASITEKCGVILEREYDRLAAGINSLDPDENKTMNLYLIKAYQAFLEDCPNSIRKNTLLELLTEKEDRNEKGSG